MATENNKETALQNMGSSANKTREYINTIVGLGVLTAVVVVLQLLSSVIKFGPFSITLALTPIIVGGALYGLLGGTWLGFVMGLTVLLSGDAAAFLSVSVPGTIITVLLKSSLAGLAAAFLFRVIEKHGRVPASIVAAIAAPVVNTGVFVCGVFVFFLDTITQWAGDTPVGEFIIFTLIGLNFPIELVVNLALSTVVVAVIGYAKKIMSKK